ncbi:MAG: PilZ domain-containing protein, partial [Pseudomonadota bacterium]|nr:PilZ domain-containing protein [Pseudomonadota bacterium]
MTDIGSRGVAPAGGKIPRTRSAAAAQAPRHTLKSNGNRVKIVRDRRRHQRVRIKLLGRFMREDKNEYPCEIHNVSAGGLAIRAVISGEPGEKIVVYVEQLGRLEGELVRVYPGGFAMSLRGSAYKREKIVNQLTWLLNRNQLDMGEERQHSRLPPSNPMCKLLLPDG